MTQCEMVLDHMKKHGGITQADAFYHYSITRLSARISNLRDRGNNIVAVPTESVNKYGKKVRYVTYRLAGGK